MDARCVCWVSPLELPVLQITNFVGWVKVFNPTQTSRLNPTYSAKKIKQFYYMKKHFLPIIILAIISSAVFLNTLHNAFVWDDTYLITDNRHIKSLSSIPLFFTPHYWNKLHPYQASGQYRPLRTATFAMDYALWQFKPAGYHLTNMVLHAVNTILVYFFVFFLPFGYNREDAHSETSWMSSFSLPFLTALLFAVHPIHTESVTYIKNRSDLLAFFFFLLTLFLFIREHFETRTKPRIFVYVCSIVCFILAVISKEVALTIPFILILYSICFFPKTELRNIIIKTTPFFILIILFFVFRHTALETFPTKGDGESITLFQNCLIIFKTIGYYLQLLVLPINLNAERALLIPETFFDPAVLSSIVIIAFIVILAVRFFNKSPVLFFAIFWILMTLVPASNLIYLESRPIAEQRLYVPSFGFCLLLAMIIIRLFSFDLKPVNKKVPAVISILLTVFLLVFYSAATIKRNQDWKDPFTFYSKTVKASPESFRAHLNLGVALAEQGRLDEAVSHYLTALKINPEYAMAYYKIGNAMMIRERLEDAVKHYAKSLQLNPNDAHAHNNMGIALLKQGHVDKAIHHCSRAVELQHDYIFAHNNLGYALAKKGRYKEAAEHFTTALKYEPNLEGAEQNLNYCLEMMEKTQR